MEFVDLDVTAAPAAPEGVGGVRRFALAGTIDLPNRMAACRSSTSVMARRRRTWRSGTAASPSGDIQIFQREVDGATRTYVGYGADYSAVATSACFEDLRQLGQNPRNGLGTWFADITDPCASDGGLRADPDRSHNLTSHPSGNYLYNSSNRISAAVGSLEVFDIRGLTNPRALPSLNLDTGINARDLTFNADGTRAYAASINHTLIIDTSKSETPKVIGRVGNAAATIHHQSDPVTIDHPVPGKRTFLVITDEVGGAAGNAFCPGGGLLVYDITRQLEQAPVFVGAWFIPQVEPLAPGSPRAGDRSAWCPRAPRTCCGSTPPKRS